MITANPKEISMSWQPSNDPVLGDPKSCDALDLIIVPRTRDLGDGFEVRRALPHGKAQMVGPFNLLRPFGPVQFMPARAWTFARIRISGLPPSPICSTAAHASRQ